MSLTIIGWLIQVFNFVSINTGVPFVADDFQGFVNFVAFIAGAVAVYWGRYRKGDIRWYGARK